MSTVTFHVGAHKTASSLLQQILRKNMASVPPSVAVLGRKINGIHEVPIVSEFTSPGLNKDAFRMPDARKIEKVRKAFDSKGLDFDGDILMTYEDFLGTFRLQRVQRLYPRTPDFVREMGAIFGDRVRYVIYIRNPVTYFVSTYVQNIQSGHIVTLKDYMENFTDAKLDWLPVIRDLQTAVGRENVHVVAFDQIKEGVEAYFRHLFRFHPQVALPASAFGGNQRSNEALSERGLKIALAAYPLMDPDERRKFKNFIRSELKRPDDQPFFPLRKPEVDAFIARNLDRLHDLADSCGNPDAGRWVRAWTEPGYYDRYYQAAAVAPTARAS